MALGGEALGSSSLPPSGTITTLVLAPPNKNLVIFLLADRQTIWQCSDSSNCATAGKQIQIFTGSERVSMTAECADGRVAVLTSLRLLLVESWNTNLEVEQSTGITLEALGVSVEDVSRLSCSGTPVLRMKSGEAFIFSPDGAKVPCGQDADSATGVSHVPANTLHFVAGSEKSVFLNVSGIFECSFENQSTKTGEAVKRLELEAAGGYADVGVLENTVYAAGGGTVEIISGEVKNKVTSNVYGPS